MMNMNGSRVNGGHHHHHHHHHHSEPRSFSRQSVLSAMDRFVQAVDNMNETVMVPSRLRDMCEVQPTSKPLTTTTTPSNCADRLLDEQATTDLHSFYTMLNSTKNELIWGGNNNNNNTRINNQSGGLTGKSSFSSLSFSMGSRRLSSVSSLSLSDSEAEMDSSCSEPESLGSDYSVQSEASDSSLIVPSVVVDPSTRISNQFRHHLVGLYNALEEMTNTADLIAVKYQEEVGGIS